MPIIFTKINLFQSSLVLAFFVPVVQKDWGRERGETFPMNGNLVNSVADP